MPLKVKLTQEELDLVDLIEDPVLFGEFMRSTRDISPIKQEWPPHEFRYRWYQKDILTDKSPEIVFTAGRAVGKCSPSSAKLFTYPHGFRTIAAILRDKEPCILLTLNHEGKFVQRRAKIASNGIKRVFRVTTENGFTFDGTDNHPILTPDGFIEIKNLYEGKEVATLRELPHQSALEPYTWEELRYLGYLLGYPVPSPEQLLAVKNKKQLEELRQISDFLGTKFENYNDLVIRLGRKIPQNHLPHPMTAILRDLRCNFSWSNKGLNKLHKSIKGLSKQSIKIIFESLFSMHAEFTGSSITLKSNYRGLLLDIKELLFYFGIKSSVEGEDGDCSLIISSYEEYCRFFSTFTIPGVKVENITRPRARDPIEYSKIVSIEPLGLKNTYMVSVPITENYISDYLLVHNSLIFEDLVLWESINQDTEFPETKEQLITTANQTQMTPVQDRLILRFTNSPLLSSFLDGNINKSKGTMDFETGTGGVYRINMRIAGSRGENNLVGLHIPRIKIDETQLFPYEAYVQLEPTWNYWEKNKRKFFCGVPTGQRNNNVLYYLDRVSPRTKKYRIPSHENPYYTKEDDRERLIRYQGKESSEYVHLVLGRHGEPTFSVIPYESIQKQPYDIFSYRYHQSDKFKGIKYTSSLKLIDITAQQKIVMAIDTGYTDPTIIQIIALGRDNIWRTFVRYRITKIGFPEQAEIIDWLDGHYNPNIIAIDIGAGGGGVGITQDLQNEKRFSRHSLYLKKIFPVQFGEKIENILEDKVIKIPAKSLAGDELTRLILEGYLVFSELDGEAISEVSRISYQKSADGSRRYFVASERLRGKANEDHIFASYLVFALAIKERVMGNSIRMKLANPKWIDKK